LPSKPALIFNVDEIGMPFDYKAPNVVVNARYKKFVIRQSGQKRKVTVVSCASAEGQAIPPVINFESQNLNHAWTKDEVPRTRCSPSEKGLD